jgi:hypothetical protein
VIHSSGGTSDGSRTRVESGCNRLPSHSVTLAVPNLRVELSAPILSESFHQPGGLSGVGRRGIEPLLTA